MFNVSSIDAIGVPEICYTVTHIHIVYNNNACTEYDVFVR